MGCCTSLLYGPTGASKSAVKRCLTLVRPGLRVGRSDLTVGLVPKTFNSDFYVVCATVIPVPFLAVAVQGNAYKAVLDAAMKAARANANDGWLRQMSALARSRTLQIIGYFIWSAGAIGEIQALQVLYQGP
jgi:hypothetical protein